MDTNQFSNILNALNGGRGLSPTQKAENYDTFNRLMEQGVSLPDLVRKVSEVDELRKRLDEMERKPSVDTETFSVMESAVKDDPSVVSARARAQEVKAQIIGELCRADPRYASALEEYSRTVHSAYVHRTESHILDSECVDE